MPLGERVCTDICTNRLIVRTSRGNCSTLNIINERLINMGAQADTGRFIYGLAILTPTFSGHSVTKNQLWSRQKRQIPIYRIDINKITPVEPTTFAQHGDQDVLQATVPQLVHHLESELDAFLVLNPDAEHIAVAVACACR